MKQFLNHNLAGVRREVKPGGKKLARAENNIERYSILIAVRPEDADV